MKNKKYRGFLKGLTVVLSALLLLGSLASCGAKTASDNAYSYATEQKAESENTYFGDTDGGYYDAQEPETSQNGGLGSAQVEKYKQDRKVIYKSEITIETKDYDNSIKTLNTLIEKYGAYVENSDVNNSGYSGYRTRYATYVVRVPKDNYKDFISESGTIGIVTRSADQNRDVTEAYIDTEARLETLKIMEERLLELLSKSQNIVDILELEQKLSETRYEIENLTGSLGKYDSLIAYSTATIIINEVEEVTRPQVLPKTFGQRIADSFSRSLRSVKNGLQNLAVALVYIVPVLCVFVLPFIIIVFVIIVIAKKKKKKRIKTKKIITIN